NLKEKLEIESQDKKRLMEEFKEKELNMKALEEEIYNSHKKLEELETDIEKNTQEINTLKSELSNKQSYLEALESERNNLNYQLSEIYKSRGYKAVLKYYKIRDALLPPQSKRRKSISIIKNEGIRVFLHKAYRKILLWFKNKKEHKKYSFLALMYKKQSKKKIQKKVEFIYQSSTDNRLVACTIVSKNYLSQSLTLADSFKKHNPNWDFKILLCDMLEDKDDLNLMLLLNSKDLFLIPIYELENYLDMPLLEEMLFKYNVLEINTAIKPFFLEYLLKKGYEKIIYLDPDILILDKFDEIDNLLDKYNIILTPHIRESFPNDGKSQTDLNILLAGIYNLGFIAVNSSEETRKFLKWWQLKLEDGCFVDIHNGMHVDQKWIDLTPIFLMESTS
ncbi:MAG: hypothetical protein QXU98_12730, partial [Candidatus Parvarchaeota archaeon]